EPAAHHLGDTRGQGSGLAAGGRSPVRGVRLPVGFLLARPELAVPDLPGPHGEVLAHLRSGVLRRLRVLHENATVLPTRLREPVGTPPPVPVPAERVRVPLGVGTHRRPLPRVGRPPVVTELTFL